MTHPPHFKYKLTEKVCHQEAPNARFVVIRRWLDMDRPQGANHFYMLRADKPLFGTGEVGPVPEVELSLAVD